MFLLIAAVLSLTVPAISASLSVALVFASIAASYSFYLAEVALMDFANSSASPFF
jgi:hypothetical protein